MIYKINLVLEFRLNLMIIAPYLKGIGEGTIFQMGSL